MELREAHSRLMDEFMQYLPHAGAVVVGLILIVLVRSSRKAAAKKKIYAKAGPGIVEDEDFRQVKDRSETRLKCFGQACFMISMGGEDYGYYPPSAPQEMLESSWDITDKASAKEGIEAMLADPHKGDDEALVFDRVRAMFLARSAAGAGYITQEASWDYIRKAGKEFQDRLEGFEAVGARYINQSRVWCEANGVPDSGTADNVRALRKTIWKKVDFNGPI